MCNVIEVIDCTLFDKSIWKRLPGERETRDVFVGHICMPPESRTRVNDIQQRFGEIATEEKGTGTKKSFVGSIYMHPESKSSVSNIQRGFGEIATTVHTYQRQGQVPFVGDFYAKGWECKPTR